METKSEKKVIDSYSPQYGCGGNVTKMFEENGNVFLEQIGYRAFNVYSLKKETLQEIVELITEESQKFRKIVGSDHYFSCGCITVRSCENSYSEARKRWLKYIYVHIHDMLYYMFKKGECQSYPQTLNNLLKKATRYSSKNYNY
jgi:hypothetical protein